MVLACLLANAIGTKDLPISPGYESVSSFQISGDQVKCLNLLSGMNSCTSDIVDFFSDRLTNLGPGCCSFIFSISKNCLPSTLASFGFTTEVHNKLQEYCDAVSGPAPAPIAGSDAPIRRWWWQWTGILAMVSNGWGQYWSFQIKHGIVCLSLEKAFDLFHGCHDLDVF